MATSKTNVVRRFILCVSVLVLARAAGAGVTTATDTASEIVMRLGHESYLQYCAACHGLDARGNGPVAARLKNVPSDLTRIAERHGGKFADREIADMIDGRAMPAIHGTREMPVWGRRFSTAIGGGDVGEEAVRGQLLILLEYLRSVQQK